MAKITIHCLVAKQTASGTRYYWQPSTTLKKAGWKALSLGADYSAAIDAARARNAEIEAWRGGGATPRQIARFAKKATVRALIERFREEELPKLAATTRKTYGTGLNRIEAWAGDEPARAITRKNVRDLRDAMTKGRAMLGTHAAHSTLKVGRVLFGWAKDHELSDVNPFLGSDLATPPPGTRCGTTKTWSRSRRRRWRSAIRRWPTRSSWRPGLASARGTLSS